MVRKSPWRKEKLGTVRPWAVATPNVAAIDLPKIPVPIQPRTLARPFFGVIGSQPWTTMTTFRYQRPGNTTRGARHLELLSHLSHLRSLPLSSLEDAKDAGLSAAQLPDGGWVHTYRTREGSSAAHYLYTHVIGPTR
jgi:hypothetical protein